MQLACFNIKLSVEILKLYFNMQPLNPDQLRLFDIKQRVREEYSPSKNPEPRKPYLRNFT